jgi:hypothetical protein
MFVNTSSLHLGANASDRAGDLAGTGADRLFMAGLTAGMFGNFQAANSFHDAVGGAKEHHTTKLNEHKEALTGIATKVRAVAAEFTDMDNANAQRLRDVAPADTR